MSKKLPAFFCACVLCAASLFAQTHTSAALESQVYYILEQAELKGLCAPLSGVRPYTHNAVTKAINEILGTDDPKKLNNTERAILEQYLAQFAKPKTGFDWQRGGIYGETTLGKSDTVISANAGTSASMEGSAGLYDSLKDRHFGTEIWVQAYLNGDLGSHVSYGFSAEGGLMQAPRKFLGTGFTYYKGFREDDFLAADENPDWQNQIIDVYSEPLTHFPYTYKKRWDGSVYFFDNLAGYEYWPDSAAGSYNLMSELTASFWENKIIVRLGRLSREWGSTPFGSSLFFNQMARPFLGVESEFNPVSWFGIASLTGILEYTNREGIKSSALQSQNAYSITMMQFKYKNYLFFDFADAVVYTKRFELGYISPVTNSFFYQNNIGDFDNMAMAANLKAQYPGLGNIWVSLFVDEFILTQDLITLDRQMYATQVGASVPLPILAFSSVKFSYTKVNPYCYTHNRNYNPWHSSLPMETAYSNNGVSLGYYLPPNSVEYLVSFKTAPTKNLLTHLQYQLIQHGADFGDSAVDGSNPLSELGGGRNNKNPVLRRFFLQDGAYQWMHIVKVGVEWNLPDLPIALFGETGVNCSYFTNTKEAANSGRAHKYTRVNTPEYPESTGFIVRIGLKIFPH